VELNEVLGRTLVIVAHADDEAVACGALLQRIREPHVVFCTDGAPRDEYFWHAYGSRESYAEVRRQEAARVMYMAGVREWTWLPSLRPDVFVDQELFPRITEAMQWLRGIVQWVRPTAFLTLAYEGGHPDHDTCNFLARQLANELHVPIWEAPLYHRARHAQMSVQQFIEASGSEVRIDLTGEELACKRAMFMAYESQREVLASFNPSVELIRPMIAHDYSRPPHMGKLNYEAWGWRMTGAQVCEAFQEYLTTAQERRERKSVA
jgi:LmbE family N-acetylglucosaminyl deacetylase